MSFEFREMTVYRYKNRKKSLNECSINVYFIQASFVTVYLKKALLSTHVVLQLVFLPCVVLLFQSY